MLNILRNTNYMFVLPFFAGISAIRHVLYWLYTLPDGRPTKNKNENKNKNKKKEKTVLQYAQFTPSSGNDTSIIFFKSLILLGLLVPYWWPQRRIRAISRLKVGIYITFINKFFSTRSCILGNVYYSWKSQNSEIRSTLEALKIRLHRWKSDVHLLNHFSFLVV